jgi:hypothetical protein
MVSQTEHAPMHFARYRMSRGSAHEPPFRRSPDFAACGTPRLESLSRTEDAKSPEAGSTRIGEAQRLTGQLNQNANAVAADAAKTIADVLGRIA